MDERKIDFTLISSERAPRNVGKTAREKAKKSTSGKPGGRRRQVGKQVNFEPDSAFRKEKTRRKRSRKARRKRKTVGENAENRRRHQSQARGKEEERRVIDHPSS